MTTLKESHLRCFVTVAGLGSITAAARKLHRSPSAVSMMISTFEDQLGRPLFEPESKTRLTPFGEYVREAAGEQLQRFDRVADSIAAYARNEVGKIDIASVPSFAIRYLPELLTSFLENYPDISLAIRDDSSERINQLLESGEIDVGIGSGLNNNQLVDFEPLLNDPIGVVCSVTHRFVDLGRPLEWRDLSGERFIVNGTCRHILAEEFQVVLDQAEIEVQNTTSLIALVASGVGITTLPKLAIPVESRDVVFIPTAYPDLQRNIGLLTQARRSLSPVADAFLDHVRDTFIAAISAKR